MTITPKKKTALDIGTPQSYEDQKPITRQLLPTLDLDLNDPIFDNLIGVKDKDYVDFNFKISLDLRTDFKRTTAAWNMSNKELMQVAYKVFLERYGRTPEEYQLKRRQAKAKAEQ